MSKELVEKISKIQSKLKAPKSQYNKFGNYAYRNQEDILEAVKPLLSEAGLMQTISDDVVEVGGRVYVKATVVVSDGENFVTSVAFAREPEDQKGMSASQITGSASSYARKYALNGMYAIDDTKDADATNDHGKSAPATKEAQSNKPATNPAEPSIPTQKEASKSGGRFTPKGAKPVVKENVPVEITTGNSAEDGWS